MVGRGFSRRGQLGTQRVHGLGRRLKLGQFDLLGRFPCEVPEPPGRVVSASDTDANVRAGDEATHAGDDEGGFGAAEHSSGNRHGDNDRPDELLGQLSA